MIALAQYTNNHFRRDIVLRIKRLCCVSASTCRIPVNSLCVSKLLFCVMLVIDNQMKCSGKSKPIESGNLRET